MAVTKILEKGQGGEAMICKDKDSLKGKAGIYKIVNLVNGKVYVGQSTGLFKRYKNHIYDLNRKNKKQHFNLHLYRACKKYQIENFAFVAIEFIDDIDKLDEREEHWIEKLCATNNKIGYNMQKVAGSNKGIILKPLSEEQIIGWVRMHFALYRVWPNQYSGDVEFTEAENWNAIGQALNKGNRGLPKYKSLSYFVGEKFGVMNQSNKKKFTIDIIKKWVIRYYKYNNKYPNQRSGIISDTEKDGFNETLRWSQIESCLKNGYRGLNTNYNLYAFLNKFFGYENRFESPKYNKKIIIEWIKQYYCDNNKYPTVNSGPVVYVENNGFGYITWLSINHSLKNLRCDLSTPCSLGSFIEQNFDDYCQQSNKHISIDLVVKWVEEFYDENQRYPCYKDKTKIRNSINDGFDINWETLRTYFAKGRKGLPKMCFKQFIKEYIKEE